MRNQENSLCQLVQVDEDKCVNCHQCVSVCQQATQMCNDGSQDHVEVNPDLCVGCGECIKACDHNARTIADEYDEFMKAVDNRENMVAIVAPSIAANFPNKYKNVNGWLKKKCNVDAVFDVSFGAELTVKSYVDYIQDDNPDCVVAQPCPALVNYVQVYEPELMQYLAPADSPMLHTIKMIKEFYPKYKHHQIVVISPCIAKKREFQQTGYGDKTYNVTFKSLVEHFDKRGNRLTKYSKQDFEGPSAERGAGFSTPGGLLQTVEREIPDAKSFTKKIEGPQEVYEYLSDLKENIQEGRAPLLIDCLNCSAGCNYGTGVDKQDKSQEELAYNVRNRVAEQKAEYKTNQSWFSKLFGSGKNDLQQVLEQHYKPNLYNRNYKNLSNLNNIKQPTKRQKDKIFENMKKTDEESREINCSSCGYDSCEQMVIAIHNDLNKVENCHHYMQDIIEEQKEIAQQHIEEVTAESEQLSAVVQELDASNETVVSRSEDTAKKAEEGLEYLRDVQKLTSQLVKKLDGLDEITETITSIADQTNLLALNASIEAAKLSDSGGFTVIAEEVRKLSEQTADETEQITPYVQELKSKLTKINQEVDEVVQDVEDSVRNSNDVVASTEEIGAGISQVNSSIQELAHSSEDFLNQLQENNDK